MVFDFVSRCISGYKKVFTASNEHCVEELSLEKYTIMSQESNLLEFPCGFSDVDKLDKAKKLLQRSKKLVDKILESISHVIEANDTVEPKLLRATTEYRAYECYLVSFRFHSLRDSCQLKEITFKMKFFSQFHSFLYCLDSLLNFLMPNTWLWYFRML